jgi:hypothetical protein
LPATRFPVTNASCHQRFLSLRPRSSSTGHRFKGNPRGDSSRAGYKVTMIPSTEPRLFAASPHEAT